MVMTQMDEYMHQFKCDGCSVMLTGYMHCCTGICMLYGEEGDRNSKYMCCLSGQLKKKHEFGGKQTNKMKVWLR